MNQSVRRLSGGLLLGFAVCLMTLPAAAREQPLWEVGLGVAPASYPDYRGSEERENTVLPLPYLVYRGDWLRVDRRGARGLLVETRNFELAISADAALPAAGDPDGAREGMDDLDSVFELGPSLDWLLHQSEAGRWRLRLPIRAAIATEFPDTFRHVGWKIQPTLSFGTLRAIPGWRTGVSVGPLFASRDYHGYYYDVGPADVTADRPAYSASGGYSGTSLTLAASRRTDRYWMGVFLRYDYLEGATFDDSPLMETSHALTAGFGIARIFWQSSRTVSPDQPGEE